MNDIRGWVDGRVLSFAHGAARAKFFVLVFICFFSFVLHLASALRTKKGLYLATGWWCLIKKGNGMGVASGFVSKNISPGWGEGREGKGKGYGQRNSTLHEKDISRVVTLVRRGIA